MDDRWEKWGLFVVGIWIFISPWIISHKLAPIVSNLNDRFLWTMGFSIALIGIWTLTSNNKWIKNVSLVLGFFLILSPWVLGYSNSQGLFRNSFLAGLLVSMFSGNTFSKAFKPEFDKKIKSPEPKKQEEDKRFSA